MPEIRAHLRPTDDQYRDGVYRVVGTGDPVALLRVTDDAGRRANTGQVEHVPRDALDDAFEPADDPDSGIDPVAGLTNALQGLYWQVRKFF
jgi:hypothetical protein